MSPKPSIPATVYLSIGTNLGNKEENLHMAVEQLNAIGKVKNVSVMFESEPWGFASTNHFLNIAVEFHTLLTPLLLLNALQRIELKMGRTTKTTTAARNYTDRLIDIDILFYDNMVISKPRLVVPHPLLHQREFVLAPMAEIAPNYTHPLLHKTIIELLTELKGE